MITTPHPRTPLALYRPWLSRVLDDFGAAWRARRAARRLDVDYADLSHLTEQTLRDIGAPDWVHERDHSVPLWLLERMRG